MTRYIKKSKPVSNGNFTIIIDDREKKGWTFLENHYGAMEKKRLRVGDYSIKGLESLVSIEKKSGLREVLGNLTGDKRQRFIRFLKRLSKVPVKCMVIENHCSTIEINKVLSDIRFKSNGRSKLTQDTVYYWVSEIMCTYNIPVLFVDKRTVRKVLPFVFERAYQRAIQLK